MYEKTTSPIVLHEEPIRNQSNGVELFAGIGGSFSSVSEIICELIDDPISNILRHHTQPGISNEITLRFTDHGARVGIMVHDGGTGIRDLHNALTIAGRGAPDGPLNAHGFGLKHAISSMACGDMEDWWIETRTKNDLLSDTFARVEGPFSTGTGENDPTMTIQHCQGTGHVGNHTGTVIYTSCSSSVFQTAKPDRKFADSTFEMLTAYIIEHLRFTYAGLLADGRICLRVITTNLQGLEQTSMLTPLLPIWADGAAQEYTDIECDLGGGRLLADFRFGQIEPSCENHFYFTGNRDSSGVQVSHNGRVITNQLFSAVYGKALHNSQNHFIAQIDLRSNDPAALPRTKNTKTAYAEGDPRYARLLKLIATYVPAPAIDPERLEDKLKAQLQAQEKADGITLRADREETAFGSAGVKALIDLFVARKDGEVVIYEAKAYQSKLRDLSQLLLYVLGCVYDGKPADRAVLIAAKHSRDVIALVPAMNELLAARGIDCKITLDTWQNRGISA